MPKVMITAPAHPCLREGLEQRGYQVEIQEKISYHELIEVIPAYEGLIVASRIQIDSEILAAAQSLKWIGRLGSGMEIIDVEQATSQQIVCMSSPDGNCESVGEHCLGLLLSLLHNICRSRDEVKEGKWLREANRGFELRGKTVGIIGLGHTGSAFAHLLAPFGVKVLAHDKYKTDFSSGHIFESTVETIKESADVISFHLPLNEETQHYANEQFFSSLNKRPYFLNTSRGGVVDTAALLDALDKGLVAAAGLDVLENEDLVSYSQTESEMFQQLLGHRNVIVTPHIAGSSHESLVKLAQSLLKKLDLLPRP
jgi:D-3-phosphoglycerate dehydrogenase